MQRNLVSSRPTVLLTGFGPFPGVPSNATAILVPRLAEAATRAFPGYRIAADVLPTEWHAGPARLRQAIDTWRPMLALHFGVSSRATGFEIEARAHNRTATDSRDAAGCPPAGRCLLENAADVLATPLPAQHIVDRLRRRGLPAILSRDAGRYLCNAILYNSLRRAEDLAGDLRSGFVHIPASLAEPGRPFRRPRRGCLLGFEDALDGGLEIIAASLGLPPRPVSRQA